MDETPSAVREPRSRALTRGCAGAKMGRIIRAIRGFLLAQAMTFVLAALIHFGIVLGGHEHERARIAESVIALVLLAGFALTFLSPERARTVGLTVKEVCLVWHVGRPLHRGDRCRSADTPGPRVSHRGGGASGLGPYCSRSHRCIRPAMTAQGGTAPKLMRQQTVLRRGA
jgi:hypothetical protein